jgi:transcriptional regulator with XRE-family HTH domain
MKLSKISDKEDNLTLKSLIESAGYTQKNFAKSLGVATSTVTYYISGEKLPRVDRFFEMCKKLNVDPITLAKSIGIDVEGIPND